MPDIATIGSTDSIHVRNRCEAMARAGNAVSLFTARKEEGWDFPQIVPPPVRHRMPLPGLRMIETLVDQHRRIKHLPGDVYHCHYAASYWTTLAMLAANRPLVVSTMGGDVLLEEQRETRAVVARRTALTLRWADLVTVKSQRIRDRVMVMGVAPERVVELNWGVDKRVFQPRDRGAARARLGLPADAFIILSPRILSPLYNQDVLIAAFAKVLREVPDALLVIMDFAPVAEYRAKLLALAEDLEIRQRTLFMDPVPNQDMPEVYAGADVTVGIPNSDGLPMTLLESMACGTPNIIGAIPDYGDRFQADWEVVFSEIEPSALARNIVALATDAERRREITRAGLDLVARTAGLDDDAATLTRLITDLIARGRRCIPLRARLEGVRCLYQEMVSPWS